MHHVTVTGVNDGYTVEAKENYAGGALGEAVGGDVDTVTLNQVKSVTANIKIDFSFRISRVSKVIIFP